MKEEGVLDEQNPRRAGGRFCRNRKTAGKRRPALISIELIREKPDLVRDAMRRRNADIAIDRILELDTRRRSIIAEEGELRARRNQVSRSLGQTKERPPELLQEMRGVGEKIKVLEGERKAVEDETNAMLLTIPNIPRDDVPLGEDESGNEVVRTLGELPSFSFEPLPHWEIGERLDIIDFKRGAKLSGSRFWGVMGIMQTTFMGLALGISYLLVKRNLWVLILAHAYMDTVLMVQMYLGVG